MSILTVSGYFDPIHVGHIEYLELAAQLGDELVVIVNNVLKYLKASFLVDGPLIQGKEKWKNNTNMRNAYELRTTYLN